jgi:hypothetical protein
VPISKIAKQFYLKCSEREIMFIMIGFTEVVIEGKETSSELSSNNKVIRMMITIG